MKKTLEVATKIAGYGADKMLAEGYTAQRMTGSAHGFYVDRPATEEEEAGCYIVGILGDFTDCTCKFHAENTICKHVVYCQRLIAEEKAAAEHESARIDAMLESDPDAYADYRDNIAYHESEAAYRMMAAN